MSWILVIILILKFKPKQPITLCKSNELCGSNEQERAQCGGDPVAGLGRPPIRRAKGMAQAAPGQ